MDIFKNYARVAAAKKLGLPFKPSTFYKWYHDRKHLEIFIKVGSALFVDLDALKYLFEESRQKKS